MDYNSKGKNKEEMESEIYALEKRRKIEQVLLLDIEQSRVDESNLLVSNKACEKWLQENAKWTPNEISKDGIGNNNHEKGDLLMTMHGRSVIGNARHFHSVVLPYVTFDEYNKKIENDPHLVVRNRHILKVEKREKNKSSIDRKIKHPKMTEPNALIQYKLEVKEAKNVRKMARDNKELGGVSPNKDEYVIHVNMLQTDEEPSQRSLRLDTRREKTAELLEAQRIARETKRDIIEKLRMERETKKEDNSTSKPIISGTSSS
jgi:hypothetical protein